MLGIGNIFAGPSFQYILSSDFGLNDLSEVSISNFSLGIQLGGGVEFGRLGIDVRWERSLSKAETKFVDNAINSEVNFYLNFYKGLYHPPTEEEYHRLVEEETQRILDDE